MSMAKLMGTFLKLQNEVDTETIGLLARFGDMAIQSGEPREFLRSVLRAVVEAPKSDHVQEVSVKLLPPKKG